MEKFRILQKLPELSDITAETAQWWRCCGTLCLSQQAVGIWWFNDDIFSHISCVLIKAGPHPELQNNMFV